MKYVIGDVHGEYLRLLALLEEVNLKDEDDLIFTGDIVDRGCGGIDIIHFIMKRRKEATGKTILVRGNHEEMMLKYYASGSFVDHFNWNINGGDTTEDSFEKLPKDEQETILSFLRSCPCEYNISTEQERFRIVHGWVAKDDYHRIWNHPPMMGNSVNPTSETTLLVGHTVTLRLYSESGLEQDYIVSRMMEDRTHLKIFHGDGWLGLDCGCGHLSLPVRRLACLRLEDRKEFYV